MTKALKPVGYLLCILGALAYVLLALLFYGGYADTPKPDRSAFVEGLVFLRHVVLEPGLVPLALGFVLVRWSTQVRHVLWSAATFVLVLAMHYAMVAFSAHDQEPAYFVVYLVLQFAEIVILAVVATILINADRQAARPAARHGE